MAAASSTTASPTATSAIVATSELTRALSETDDRVVWTGSHVFDIVVYINPDMDTAQPPSSITLWLDTLNELSYAAGDLDSFFLSLALTGFSFSSIIPVIL